MSSLKIAYIGAGAVNFGGAEGPWNHSARLEKLGGVYFVAIVDPLVERAKSLLETKLKGPSASMYSECCVLPSYKDVLKMEARTKPDAVFVGVPPFVHGSLEEGHDIELEFVRAGIHVFVEKPVSVVPPERFREYVQAVVEEQQKTKVIISVAYMFRYHSAVQKIKEIITAHGRPVLSINARYNCAYSELDHPFWWNTSKSGGPIVEQATHFCDLLRYFAGEVNLASIQATSIPPGTTESSIGYLSKVPAVVNEESIPVEQRIPRVTSANWKFESGSIGCLTHGLILWSKRYEASIDIWADGLRITLEEPYFPECKLRVRRGYTDQEEVLTYPDVDPYLEEDRLFLEAVRTGNHDLIRSSYVDAARTYEMSWAIHRASEQ